MITSATLAIFLPALLALYISPGPNMAFVVTHAAALGPRAGFAAAAGIGLGDLLLTLLSALGVTALVAGWPPALQLLRYGGAAYLLWLARGALRPRAAMALGQAHGQVLRRAFLACLLNPKTLLFFLIFLPQFVDVQRGQVPLQLTILGLILSAGAGLFNAMLALFSGQAARLLAGGVWQGRVLALVFCLLAVRLVLL